MNLNVKLFSVIFMFLMFSSCSVSKLEKKTIKIQKQDGTFVSVVAEIADTEESRTYGFMNRKKIPDGTGMLFVFDYDQLLSFWMKNTPTALSIAYITSDGYIKDIFDIKEEKDLTVSAHWTIKKSVVEKVKQIAKDKKISDSKVVNTILEDFFKNK